MFFCTDVDISVLEPALLGAAALAAYGLVTGKAGTLAQTTLVVTGVDLAEAGVAAGMMAQVTSGDGTVTRMIEMVAVNADGSATASVLRPRDNAAAVAPDVQGAVTVSVVSLRPLIAEVGDELLAVVGIASDRAAADVTLADATGFRAAATFGTLAAAYRVLRSAGDTAALEAKETLYERAYATLKRALVARVDQDGDGDAETIVRGGVRRMYRV